MLKPLRDIIIVKRAEPKTVSEGGIVLSPGAEEELNEGVVIAAGPGKITKQGVIPNSLKEGDKVLYSKYANLKTVIDGKPYVTMQEADVICVIE